MQEDARDTAGEGGPPTDETGKGSPASLPQLTRFGNTLCLVHIEKYDVPACMHALVSWLLLEAVDTGFISFTETDEEVSLICSTACASRFPRGTVTLAGGPLWKGYHLVGTGDINEVGIIAKATGPLAAEGVSVLCVSELTSNFILVRETAEQCGWNALCATGSFHTVEMEEAPSQPLRVRRERPVTPKHSVGAEHEVSLVMIKLPFRVRIVRFTNIEKHFASILKLAFYPPTHDRFFCITRAGGTLKGCVTLVLEASALETLDHGSAQGDPFLWVPLQICEGDSGYSKPGLLHAMAEALAAAGLTIFNHSTFNTHFLFVREGDVDAAVRALSGLVTRVEDHTVSGSADEGDLHDLSGEAEGCDLEDGGALGISFHDDEV